MIYEAVKPGVTPFTPRARPPVIAEYRNRQSSLVPAPSQTHPPPVGKRSTNLICRKARPLPYLLEQRKAEKEGKGRVIFPIWAVAAEALQPLQHCNKLAIQQLLFELWIREMAASSTISSAS